MKINEAGNSQDLEKSLSRDIAQVLPQSDAHRSAVTPPNTALLV